MAWPSVGNYSVVRMTGNYAGLCMVDRVEEVTRPGVDGVAFGHIGLRSQPVEVVTEHDALNFLAALDAFKALERKFVTIVTPEQNVVPAVFVHSVLVTGQRLAKSAGGLLRGAGVQWVTARWTLQATE